MNRLLLCSILLLTLSSAPARANDSVAASVGEMLAYYYSVEEFANFCQTHAGSAAPGLPGAFENWQARNRLLVGKLEERFALEVASDMDADVMDTRVQNEVERNWRATRNAASRYQRGQLMEMEGGRLRDACAGLNNALLQVGSDLDQHNAEAWETVFFRVPATRRAMTGLWSTEPRCRGEIWSIRGDGTEQVTLVADDLQYGYKGEWTLADGLFRSEGVENDGTRVTMIGNAVTDASAELLTLELTHQTVTPPDGPAQKTSPDDLYTVTYQRCPPGSSVVHYNFDQRRPPEPEAASAPPPSDEPETLIYAKQPQSDPDADNDRGGDADGVSRRRPGR